MGGVNPINFVFIVYVHKTPKMLMSVKPELHFNIIIHSFAHNAKPFNVHAYKNRFLDIFPRPKFFFKLTVHLLA